MVTRQSFSSTRGWREKTAQRKCWSLANVSQNGAEYFHQEVQRNSPTSAQLSQNSYANQAFDAIRPVRTILSFYFRRVSGTLVTLSQLWNSGQNGLRSGKIYNDNSVTVTHYYRDYKEKINSVSTYLESYGRQ